MGRHPKVRSQVKKPELLPLATHIKQLLEEHHLNALQFVRLAKLGAIKTTFYNLLACDYAPGRASLGKIAEGLRLLTGEPIYTRSYLDDMIDLDTKSAGSQQLKNTIEVEKLQLFSSTLENDNNEYRLCRGGVAVDEPPINPSSAGAKEFGRLLRQAMEAENPPLNAVTLADFLNASAPPLPKISFVRLQQILQGSPAPTPGEITLLLRFLINAVPDGGNYERFLHMVYPPPATDSQPEECGCLHNGEPNGSTHLNG